MHTPLFARIQIMDAVETGKAPKAGTDRRFRLLALYFAAVLALTAVAAWVLTTHAPVQPAKNQAPHPSSGPVNFYP